MGNILLASVCRSTYFNLKRGRKRWQAAVSECFHNRLLIVGSVDRK